MIAFISHPDCLLHEMTPGHPERPQRLHAIANAINNSPLKTVVQHFSSPLATREQLLYVHDENYIDALYQIAPKTGLCILDPDTAMNPHTLQAALHAAGAVIMAVDLVMTDQIKLAFCNVRPPGHHAERASAMGFCFFNNLAIGVAHALQKYHLQRIAIIDFDVHHGNGTEDIFAAEPRVLLCSAFQSPFYPYSGVNTHNPHIINLPLAAGTTGVEFRSVISKYWLPAINEFQPQLIFFSAGFDGHSEEILADWMLVEADYAWLTQQIKIIAENYCQGRMISVLEGGYALDALGRSAFAHIAALL